MRSPFKKAEDLDRKGKTPFERMLISRGLATASLFDRAVQISDSMPCSLFKAVELAIGKSLPADIYKAYRRFSLFELGILYGMRSQDLESLDISAIVSLINKVIPLEICRIYQLLPLDLSDTTLTIGMAIPRRVSELELIYPLSKFTLERRVVLREDYERIWDEVMRFLSNRAINRERQVELDRFDDLAISDQQFESESDEDPDDLANINSNNQNPIVSLVDKILTKALIKEASEILIEPLENSLRVRFRIDGILQDFQPQLPPKIAGALINRCKIIADLDIAKHKIPQFGKFQRLFKNRKINFHINTLPIATGEKVAIKIFDNVTVRKFIDSVIVDASIRLIAENLCNQRSGLIIVTGPNDASISTILYSLLDRINHLGKAAYTVEEQIGYPLPDTGITQVEVRKNTNMADTLRSLRQHKPEFVMVNAISSPEVCEAILEIAANCTVLTSLPANHSVTALSKLMALANPAAISTVLNGLIFQYALPQLCSFCYIRDRATKEELVACKLDPNTEPICYRAEIFDPRIPSAPYCGECKGTGYYQHHINAFEIMSITDDLRIEIAKGTAPIQIRQMAIDAGMQTLLAYSHDLLKQGYTSLADIARMMTDTALPEEKEFNTSRPTSTSSENSDSISSGSSENLDSICLVANLGIRNFDPEEIFLSIVDTIDLLDFSNRELIAKAGMDIEIFASYQYMREQLLRLLQKSGITCIETVGKTFDPNLHELVKKKNTVNNHPTNTILNQFKRGYMLGDHVLRRAEVEVAVSLI